MPDPSALIGNKKLEIGRAIFGGANHRRCPKREGIERLEAENSVHQDNQNEHTDEHQGDQGRRIVNSSQGREGQNQDRNPKEQSGWWDDHWGEKAEKAARDGRTPKPGGVTGRPGGEWLIGGRRRL